MRNFYSGIVQVLFGCCLAITSSVALADPASAKYDSGFYVLGGFGSVNGSGGGGSNAWNIGGGYDFNRYFAIEVGYEDLWRKNAHSWSNAGTVSTTDNATGIRLGLIGKLPINDSFKLIAGIEELSVKRDKTGINGAGDLASGSVSINVPAIELGGELHFDMRTSLRATYFQTSNITMPANFPGANTQPTAKISGFLLGVVARF